ncbi:Arf GTPase activating protein [Cynara cardunculus var. scolymus]|uniref:Arf GTPase activating protein n=1 Tax=Cynara cardunculus var. scolymus TaxID=59895 RepID=A0A103XC62_CYNCS|nr:Arf GTPase activating protein [Cynara cardunculus var. scolymus]
MYAKNEETDDDHVPGTSLYDLLHLHEQENRSDELDEQTPSPSNSAKHRLASFSSESGNDLCADCGSPNPKWVSANLGAFVCIKCSGVHRSLGVHISKILSVNLDEWTEEDVDNVIKLGGNTAVNFKYEASIPDNRRKPQPDSSTDERSDFIRRKYVMQQFLDAEEQLSCPFPAAFHCSSTGLNSVVEKKYINSAGMVEFVGLIKVNVVRGIDLAIRDSVKTRVIKNCLNPVWNEKLMLSIPDNVPLLKVSVFDKDKFTTDDFMGEAEIDIEPLVSAAKALENCKVNELSTQHVKPAEGKDNAVQVNDGVITLAEALANFNMDELSTQVKTTEGEDNNAQVNDGVITLVEGKAKQEIAIKLQNVESGELQIELECVPLTQ